MFLYGKERHMALTTQAWADISSLCLDGDFSNFPMLLTGGDAEIIRNGAKIAAILNRCGEAKARFMGEEFNDPLPEEAFGALSISEFTELMQNIKDVIVQDQTGVIETKTIKKNEPVKE